MSDIKWIHLDVNMPNDEKIKIIKAMPDNYPLLWAWVQLLCLAGKTNAQGYIYINEMTPYNEEQLASVLDLPLNTTRLALGTFQNLGMIESDGNGHLLVLNFPKWNNLEALEKLRITHNERQQRYRERQKVLLLSNGDPSRDVTVTGIRGGGGGEEEDKEKDTIYEPPVSPPLEKGDVTSLIKNNDGEKIKNYFRNKRERVSKYKKCPECEFKALTNYVWCPECQKAGERVDLVTDYKAGKYGHMVQQ